MIFFKNPNDAIINYIYIYNLYIMKFIFYIYQNHDIAKLYSIKINTHYEHIKWLNQWCNVISYQRFKRIDNPIECIRITRTALFVQVQ